MIDINTALRRARHVVLDPVTLSLVITCAALVLVTATAGGWAAGGAVAALACGWTGLAAGFANSGST